MDEAFRILAPTSSLQEEPKKKEKKGGFLVNLLPTIGGTVGAVGGGLLGGLGTFGLGAGVGAAAGGAGGSALGEWLRQQITGDKEAGAGAVAREAAFGAIPGVGKVGGAVKAVRAARNSREGAADILGKVATKEAESADNARSALLGKNVLTLGQNQASREGDLGSNILALMNNKRAGEAEQFNRLAKENILKLSDESAGRGLPLADGGGMLMRPGKQPSFASEGVELQNAARLPLSSTQRSPLTQPQRSSAAEILQPSSVQMTDDGRPVSALGRQAERLFGKQTGIMPGARVGSQSLTAKRSSELKSHIRNNIGAKATDAADTILRRNEAFISTKSRELGAVLDAKNVPLNPGEAPNILAKMKMPTGVDLPNNSTYQSLLMEASQVKDLKGLEQFRRNIDEIINFSRNSQSPDPIAERVALNARRAIDDHMGKKVPELKPIKQELSKAYDTKTFIEPAAAKPQGFRPFGLNLGGRAMQSASGALSRGADILAGTPKPAGAAPSMQKQLATEGLKQGGTRLGAAAILGTPLVGSGNEEPAPQESPIDMGSLEQALAGANVEPQITEQEATLQALQIMAMNAAANGDTEIANSFMKQAEMLGATAEESKQEGKVNSAKIILDNLMKGYRDVGGGQGIYGGTVSDLLGRANIGSDNDLARGYEQQRMSYLTPIIKAFGEVGVLTDKDREVIANAIPSIKDTPERAAQKEAQLYTMLESLNGGGGSSGSSEALAILQQLGLAK